MRYPLSVFSAGGPCEQVVHPAFPLLTTASSTLQSALKDGFGEAVVACYMPETCKFPSLDSPRSVLLTLFFSFFSSFFRRPLAITAYILTPFCSGGIVTCGYVRRLSSHASRMGHVVLALRSGDGV